jgi:hypothetical protein
MIRCAKSTRQVTHPTLRQRGKRCGRRSASSGQVPRRRVRCDRPAQQPYLPVSRSVFRLSMRCAHGSPSISHRRSLKAFCRIDIDRRCVLGFAPVRESDCMVFSAHPIRLDARMQISNKRSPEKYRGARSRRLDMALRSTNITSGRSAKHLAACESDVTLAGGRYHAQWSECRCICPLLRRRNDKQMGMPRTETSCGSKCQNLAAKKVWK